MRILFITSTYLGDAVLSTGILEHIRKTYPQAKISIAAGPIAAPIFDALPNRDKTYIIRKKFFSFHWVLLWSQCLFTLWDLVVDVRGTGVSYFLLTRRRKVWISSTASSLRVHQIARWLNLKKTPQNKIWTNDRNKKEAEALLPKGATYIAFSPAANWDKKCWPLDSFSGLGKKLLKDKKNFPKGKIVILGTASQRKKVAPLFHSFEKDQVIDLMGKVSLTTLSSCLSRCSLFVGNDSGLMHLAAASNTPTLGLFGPSPVHIYGPWGEKTAAVSLPETQEKIFQRVKEGEEVMQVISVSQAEAEIKKSLLPSKASPTNG